MKNVKVITGELQHNLVIVDINKKQKNKTEWKPEYQKQNVANQEMNHTDSFLNVGLKKLCLTTIMIYGDLLKEVCQRLAMKFVDIEKNAM